MANFIVGNRFLLGILLSHIMVCSEDKSEPLPCRVWGVFEVGWERSGDSSLVMDESSSKTFDSVPLSAGYGHLDLSFIKISFF